MEFEVVIGLEVHVQLNTRTKLFCSCATSFGDTPNSNTCPVCLGLPGALPTPNREAIKKAVYFGRAIGAQINKISYFDRKNYFYPDLPLGYQISQLPVPIVENGFLNIETDGGGVKKIRIARAHLEIDAGKNIHEAGFSKVDLNRAGTPLIEIVSEPDLRSSTEAIAYLKKLHAIVKYLNISDANMQEGSFRCDANVSIRPRGDEKLYTRVEIKNINSFKFIQKAIDLEVQRQSSAWLDGIYEREVCQETRLYDSAKNQTRSMRGKEGSADYRYFFDPDLGDIDAGEVESELGEMVELPDDKKRRYVKDLGLSDYDAGVITADTEAVLFFESLLEHKVQPKNAVTWMCVELAGRLNKAGQSYAGSSVDPSALAGLIAAIENGTVSNKAAKDVLDLMLEKGIGADAAIEKLGLKQLSSEGDIQKIIDAVLEQNAPMVQKYKNGEEKLFGFFVGQVMKASGGKANPKIVNESLKKSLLK